MSLPQVDRRGDAEPPGATEPSVETCHRHPAATRSAGLKRHWRGILFFLPLAIVFGIPALVLWLGGEFTNPDTVVARQAKDDRLILHGPAYTNSASYVKVRRIILHPPQVLVLGNSRVMQFRSRMFLPGVSFYNAGGCVAKIQHFRAFLERLPREALPKTLIIATDAGYFTAGFDKLDKDGFNVPWLVRQMSEHSSPPEIFQANWRAVWGAVHERKINWRRLASLDGLSTRIGLTAVSRDQGFRNDGSYRYGGIDLDITNPAHRDYGFKNTLRLVNGGRSRFSWGAEPNPAALAEMDALLDFCHARGVEVVGFMPPHAHAVWAAMEALGDKYAYVKKLEPALRARFEQRGFEFHNFSDFAALGAPDTEAIDGYHGSERTYLRLMIAMLESGSRLNAVADLPALRAALAAARRHTDIFPESR